MVTKKTFETLKSTIPSPNDRNMHFPPSETPCGDPNPNILTGSCNEVDQVLSTRTQGHQLTLEMDGAAHEQRDFPSIRTDAHGRRQDRVDEECLSRAKMWDPVKDCSDPHTIKADVPGFISPRHSSNEDSMDSNVGELASVGLRFSYGNHPYGRVQDSRQHFMDPVSRGVISSSLSPDPQSHALTSKFQPNASTDSQQSSVGPVYHPRERSHQLGHENFSTLPSHFRSPSGQYGQQSLESVTVGATPMGIQAHQNSSPNGHPQERGQQFAGVESRASVSMRAPTPMASHESVSRSLLPSMTLNVSTPGRSGPQQADHTRQQVPLADISQALSMAHYAERMDEESNPTEAVRAYEQACALFQDLIVRSWSLEDRVGCNDAVSQ